MRRTLASLLATATCLVPLPAFACGGLFCSRTPVVQNGEKILFATDTQNVIAYVQITYQGDANQFSWVVPVPTEPTLAVGTDNVFSALMRDTQPTFRLDVKDEGKCKDLGNLDQFVARPTAAKAAAPGSVTVVAQDQVGPYDSAIIQSDDPGALKQWLKDNNYVLPPKLDPLLDPYVAGKYYFVALKLTKDRSVGDIQPIVLKYKSTKPGIPIRLTGVAANPDMDVYVWVLGKQRAIPENYRHAIINEARIDWTRYGSNYRDVVTQAMNEAGGQAFVTDYAGGSQIVQLGNQGDALENQVQQVTSTDPVQFYNQVLGLFRGTSKGQSFVKKYIPKPTTVTDPDPLFYNNLGNYQAQLRANQTKVDVQAARQQLETELVKPEQEAEQLFKGLPYLTRLYTTMSPEEMTQDPMFVFNPDLPLVAKDHVATGVRLCSANLTEGEAPIQITLENSLTYTFNPKPVSGGGLGKLPAAARVEQLKNSGGASVIKDNSGEITKTLASANVALGASGSVVSVPKAGLTGFGCAGCGMTNNPAVPVKQGADEGLAYALVVMGFVGYRRWVGRRRK